MENCLHLTTPANSPLSSEIRTFHVSSDSAWKRMVTKLELADSAYCCLSCHLPLASLPSAPPVPKDTNHHCALCLCLMYQRGEISWCKRRANGGLRRHTTFLFSLNEKMASYVFVESGRVENMCLADTCHKSYLTFNEIFLWLSGNVLPVSHHTLLDTKSKRLPAL